MMSRPLFRRIYFGLISLFLVGGLAFTNVELNGWETVADGIVFQKFHVADPAPVDIFVARLDRSNPAASLESSIAQGRLSGGLETVSDMAVRYDQTLNFWGAPEIPANPFWGARSKVAVAINGFYYGEPVEDAGVPWGGQVYSSWYAKHVFENSSVSGFIWTKTRDTFIGTCITHPESKQFVDTPGGDFLLDGVNVKRGEGKIVLYTPQYDRTTGTDDSGTEVLVEMKNPARISVASTMPIGVVTAVRQGAGNTPIPFNAVVVSGQGAAGQELKNSVAVGDLVGIAQRVKDCNVLDKKDWESAYAGIGGAFHFLKDGEVQDFSGSGQANVRDPRTAIVYNQEYVYFIVADGRNPGVSEGMTIPELAQFAKETLLATDGVAQDGGGSSTMVVDGAVVNNTTCNNIYCTDKVFLPLIQTGNRATQAAHEDDNLLSSGGVETEWIEATQSIERLVANGMMMVVVEYPDYSPKYVPGRLVTTKGSVPIRLGPGRNYSELTTISGDGVIRESFPLWNEINLDGIEATGSKWWLVEINGTTGWVDEGLLDPQLKQRRTNVDKTR